MMNNTLFHYYFIGYSEIHFEKVVDYQIEYKLYIYSENVTFGHTMKRNENYTFEKKT